MTGRRFAAHALIGATLASLALVRGEFPGAESATASAPPAMRPVENSLDLGDWQLVCSRQSYAAFGIPYPLMAVRSEARSSVRFAAELAALVRSLPTAKSVREFFRIVELSLLAQPYEASFQETPCEFWWGFLDPGICGGSSHAMLPQLSVKRLVPFAGGWIAEVIELHGDGRWKRLRVFVAPGVYLMQDWLPARSA